MTVHLHAEKFELMWDGVLRQATVLVSVLNMLTGASYSGFIIEGCETVTKLVVLKKSARRAAAAVR